MLLKSMRLKGFKSFADQTDVYFTPGVNVLVGPNGCGKSNVVEAVRWVLGDSARELRGHKQEDVIFNGSDANRALSLAHVSILLDNQDGTLPLEFFEVNLSRKLFRSGENEYSINYSKVRLKAIHALFSGTGMGRQGYAIVGQGELEQVLNGTPFSRRLILEETAGIVRFRQEREEIQRRLAASEQDILRLQDLLLELRQQREGLAEKYERAKSYQAWKTEFDQLEEQRLGCELAKAASQYQANLEKTAEFTQALRGKQDLLRQTEEALAWEEDRLTCLAEELARGREDMRAAESALQNKETEEALLQERIYSYQARIQQTQAAREKNAGQIEQMRQELAGYERLNEENLVVLTQEKSCFIHEEARLTAEADWLQQTETQLQGSGATEKELQEKSAVLRLEASQAEKTLLLQQEQIRVAEQAAADSARTIEEGWRQCRQIEKELQVLETSYEQQRQQTLVHENAYTALVLREQAQLREQARVTGEVQRFAAQLQALEDIEAGYALYSSGVQAVLAEQEQRRPTVAGILGTIADLVRIPEGFELAFEVAVGRALENVVIETGQQAREAIAFLERKKVGRATFLPLDMLKLRVMPETTRRDISSQPGVLGLAAELVVCDASIDRAVQYLFGNIVVVDALNSGLTLFRRVQYPLRIVTLNGALLNSSGAITGGFNRGNHAGILTKKAEKSALTRRLAEINRQLAREEDKSAALSAEVNAMNIAWQQEEKQLVALEFNRERARQNSTEDAARQATRTAQQALTLARLDELRQAMTAEEENHGRLQAELDQLHRQQQQEAGRLAHCQQEYYEIKRDHGVKRERLQALRDQIQMKEAEIAQNTEHLNKYRQIEADYRRSWQEADANLTVYQSDMYAGEQQLLALSATLDQDRAAIQALFQKQREASSAHERTLQQRKRLQEAWQTQQQETEQIQRDLHSQELQKVRIETAYENKLRQWEDTFRRPYAPSGGQTLTESELKTVRQQVAALKEALEGLGSVDVQVVTEFQALDQRVSYLSQQLDDLRRGHVTLTQLLARTEQRLEEDFRHFFQHIDRIFCQTVQSVFGGGEGALRLIAAEEPLQAGVDIVVKLPGKKRQPLSLLSGGERALTCIAFLFALLQLQPAPFCFLDEIDAALDENNLIRFNQYLSRMARQTQFIIISHRQSTIVNGDHILGVTMAQKGVSQCVSLSLEEASRLIEDEAIAT